MKDGQKIMFHGEGDQEPVLEPGDIVIVLDEKEHTRFQRSGNNLIMKTTIELVEALCGFQKTIKTLDNRTLLVTSHAGWFSNFNRQKKFPPKLLLIFFKYL
jgi:DnaJ-class molecular chaperone